MIAEAGRPERAWDAEGDRDLDFARDELIARLAARGIRVTVEDQYVCP